MYDEKKLWNWSIEVLSNSQAQNSHLCWFYFIFTWFSHIITCAPKILFWDKSPQTVTVIRVNLMFEFVENCMSWSSQFLHILRSQLYGCEILHVILYHFILLVIGSQYNYLNSHVNLCKWIRKYDLIIPEPYMWALEKTSLRTPITITKYLSVLHQFRYLTKLDNAWLISLTQINHIKSQILVCLDFAVSYYNVLCKVSSLTLSTYEL